MATRTSHRWQSKPGRFDALHAQRLLPSDNDWGIPTHQHTPASQVPARLVPYRKRIRANEPLDDGAANAQVFSDGRRLGVWVNAADDPVHCDFILPSVLRRGDLTVAVSSGGTSPALSRTIREELEIYFTEEYGLLAKMAAEARAELHGRGVSVPFETWRRALSGEVRQLLMRGDVARAKALLLRELGVEL
jgi:hypothetical protein